MNSNAKNSIPANAKDRSRPTERERRVLEIPARREAVHTDGAIRVRRNELVAVKIAYGQIMGLRCERYFIRPMIRTRAALHHIRRHGQGYLVEIQRGLP